MKSLKEELIEQYGMVMKPTDVAVVIHQHPAHVRRLCESGQIPAVKIGDRWHIHTEKFGRILDGCDE